jgi:hypothetical protein
VNQTLEMLSLKQDKVLGVLLDLRDCFVAALLAMTDLFIRNSWSLLIPRDFFVVPMIIGTPRNDRKKDCHASFTMTEKEMYCTHCKKIYTLIPDLCYNSGL